MPTTDQAFGSGASGSPPAMSIGGHTVGIDRIAHRYGSFTAVRDVSMEIASGELVALLGPSGCGKTTLLRIIAGFVTPTEGQILVDGAPITRIPPHRRGVGIVFQNYALFPHMTVEQNVAYGLEARGASREKTTKVVEAMVELVHLDQMRKRYPRELSGGQQQRVALARALAVEPKILLLDEPFGALDKNLRLDMQIEIRRLQRELGITAILVTHDQEEAMSMADRIAVMQSGSVEQFASPVEIYDRPATVFVNTFVGTTNLLSGNVGSAGEGGCRFELQGAGAIVVPNRPGLPAGKGLLSIRPENFRIGRAAEGQSLSGEVRAAIPLGSMTVYEVELGDGQRVRVTEARNAESDIQDVGAPVVLSVVSPAATSLFAAP